MKHLLFYGLEIFMFSILVAVKVNCSYDTKSLAIFWSREIVYHLLQDIDVVAMYMALGQSMTKVTHESHKFFERI